MESEREEVKLAPRSNPSNDSDELIVNVKTINNETYSVSVFPSSSIAELKSKVEEATRVEVDRQRLIYRGRVLADADTISTYQIENGNTVHMVAKPANYRELQRQASSQPVPNTRVVTGQQNSSAAALPPNASVETIGTGRILRAGGIDAIPFMLGEESINPLIVRSLGRSGFGGLGFASALAGSAVNSASTNAAAGTQQQGATRSHSHLENIRQGILSVHTLLSMNPAFQTQYHSPETDADNVDESSEPLPPWRQFYCGQWVDVKDTVQQWLEATVMNVDSDRRMVFVHYNGWPQRWDEWIRWDSPRIAPFRSRTTHSVLTGTSCPTPNVVPPHAQQTGTADLRTVIPEIVRVYQSLQPMMTALAESVSEDLRQRPTTLPTENVAEGMPWQQYLRVSTSTSTNVNAQDIEGDAVGGSLHDSTASPSEIAGNNQLHEKYIESVAVMNRFGRVLTDFSSLLWSEVDTYRPPSPANNLFAGLSGQFAANSLEARLINLLRERPPSPPSIRAYRSPINGLIRPEENPIPGLGRDRHVDIHIAFMSSMPPINPVPASVRPTESTSATSATSAGPLASSTVSSSTDDATAVGSVRSTSPRSSSALDSSPHELEGSSTGTSSTLNRNTDTLTRSVADLTTSLQMQAQQLARRTQELSERTSVVTEITQTLGDILRTRREQLESLQEQQQHLASSDSSTLAPVPAEPTSSASVPRENLHSLDRASPDDASHRSSSPPASHIDGSGSESGSDEDSLHERQFLEDLLLREYVQGGDGEDAEDERLLDIEMDLLHHAMNQSRTHRPRLGHHHHHHHHPHQLHQRSDSQHDYPLLEPQDVSDLVEHDRAVNDMTAEDYENTDYDSGADEQMIAEDEGLTEFVESIMKDAEREDLQEQEQLRLKSSIEERDDEDERDGTLLQDLDADVSCAIAEVVSDGTTLMPPVEESDEVPHSGSTVVHCNHSEATPFFNLPNSNLVEDTQEVESSPATGGSVESLATLAVNEDSSSGRVDSQKMACDPTFSLEALAYSKDFETANETTDMPFIQHEELIETEDFAEEPGDIPPAISTASSTTAPRVSVNALARTEMEQAEPTEDNDESIGSNAADAAPRRRGSGMSIFQRLFSMRR
jgi:hypothetical protein